MYMKAQTLNKSKVQTFIALNPKNRINEGLNTSRVEARDEGRNAIGAAMAHPIKTPDFVTG